MAGAGPPITAYCHAQLKAWMPTPAFAWGRLSVGTTTLGRRPASDSERQHEVATEGERIAGALRVGRRVVVERIVVGIGVIPADLRTDQQSGDRRGNLGLPGHA